MGILAGRTRNQWVSGENDIALGILNPFNQPRHHSEAFIGENGVTGSDIEWRIGMGSQRQGEVGLHVLGIEPQLLDVTDKATDAHLLQYPDRDQVTRERQRLPEPGRAVKFPAVILRPPYFGCGEVVQYHGGVVDHCSGRNAG